MSKEQLTALLAKLKDDVGLKEKLFAVDIDTAVSLANEAGFDVSKADLGSIGQEEETLSDEQLESVAGGLSINFHVEWPPRITTS